MDEKIPISKLFSRYEPDEAGQTFFASACVLHADINAQARAMTVFVTSDTYLPQKSIDAACREISKLYALKELRIEPKYSPDCLADFDYSEIKDVIVRRFSFAAGILAGCSWEREGKTLHLQLKANGVDQLEQYLPEAERYIAERFDTHLNIQVHSGLQVQDKNDLFAATERIRQEAASQIPAAVFAEKKEKKSQDAAPAALFGRPFKGDATPMAELDLDMFKVIVEGEVFAVEHKELKKRNAWVIGFNMTDYNGSVHINQFMEPDKAKPILDGVKKGMWLRVQGKMSYDRFSNENVLQPQAIMVIDAPKRRDTAPEKRVELHLHTTMSAMDALTNTAAAVKQAAAWGHRAIAITDHGVLQSFPDAMYAAGTKVAGTDETIKILYGCEAYYVNDVDDRICVHGSDERSFDDEFVCFDLETTGLSHKNDEIIEIGAVIMRGGEMCETFDMLIDPGRKLDRNIVELTGITDEMLKDAPKLEEVLPKFMEFCGDRPLVAHNADFDIGFLKAACARMDIPCNPTNLCTLIMSQNLMPQLKKFKLNIVADALSLPDFNHHRASDDAITVGHMLKRFFAMMQEKGVNTVQSINPLMETLRAGGKVNGRQARHLIMFAKNQTGLRNLYRLVSYAHLKYFHRNPRIPKSELMRWREGLIIGSACEAGELFRAVVDNKSEEELKRIASFYDFLEIQPLCNNMFMLRDGTVQDVEQLKEFNRTVVRLGRELGKPVVATGDVHFLNPQDEIFRHMLLASKGFSDADSELPLYFKTTDEMLEEFSYLGEETAYEVVVKNPNMIADMCDRFRPLPRNLFAPSIENSRGQLEELVYGKLDRLYGDSLPEQIKKRVDTEMHDIIGRHYDVIYMSAQKLVQNSLDHGYLVGSRGSVGSSIVAFLSGITEVNSFPPHYRCPNCKNSDFDVPKDYKCGADLPDAVCPVCGTAYEKDGFDIPFETFLGFGGDKVPDIDLNFSGEYQAKAHKYTFELFGESQVFRAGTIGTVAENTAYGYAKKYLDERNRIVSKAEEDRLAKGCVGVKRTTGQHPGGLVVIPAENEIYDFCPVQHPADDAGSDIITTHFEYHCMEENLLKLDMLGHDDPTMIRMLEDLTGVDAKKIPLDDKDTMSIFTSSKVLGYENDSLLGPTGAVAIPEFGTSFTRQMLCDTQPDRFDTLVRLSGYSHGTDVWLGNAKDLILGGIASVNETIGCRDDIMLYLISVGIDEKKAFKFMEAVRKGAIHKGKPWPDGIVEEMQAHGVPEWYIESCRKIQYLFPKAHAVAYVMMAFRIAWFKVHEPLAFYSAYFYRRSQKGGFDAAMMTRGKEAVLEAIQAIKNNPAATAKDEDMLTTLEVCYEFYLRGFEFARMDLYESDALRFNLKDGKLLPPFVSVSGLGETAALDIAEGRKGKQFLSIEEFSSACPKVSKTHIENLKAAGVFGDLPDSSQITLF